MRSSPASIAAASTMTQGRKWRLSTEAPRRGRRRCDRGSPPGHRRARRKLRERPCTADALLTPLEPSGQLGGATREGDDRGRRPGGGYCPAVAVVAVPVPVRDPRALP